MDRNIVGLVVVLALLGAACGAETADTSAEVAPAADAAEEEGVPPGLEPKGGYQAGIRDNCTQSTQGGTSEIFALDNLFAPECAVLVTDQIIQVTNLGVRDHTFTISEQAFKQTPFLVDMNVEGGESSQTEFALGDVLEPGVYTFFCSFHAGMDGELQLLEAIG